MVLHTLFSSDRITEKPNKMNLGAEAVPRRILACYPSYQALVRASTSSRPIRPTSLSAGVPNFGVRRPRPCYHCRPQCSGRTSIEDHHRYPSGKKTTHPANIILARVKQSIDPDFLSYLTCPSYFDHSSAEQILYTLVVSGPTEILYQMRYFAINRTA